VRLPAVGGGGRRVRAGLRVVGGGGGVRAGGPRQGGRLGGGDWRGAVVATGGHDWQNEEGVAKAMHPPRGITTSVGLAARARGVRRRARPRISCDRRRGISR